MNESIMIILLTGLLGLVIGSFLNVVIFRTSQNIDSPGLILSFITPRSHCMHCQSLIRFWHNIPLISYIFLKGRCADCQAFINWQYPLVEFLTALLSMSIIFFMGFTAEGIATIFFVWFLIPLMIIDLKHHVLPDFLVYGLLWLGLFCGAFSIIVSPSAAIIGGITGYLFFWIVAQLFQKIYKKEGLGQGDVKLLAALGAWVGWELLPLLVLLAALLGLFLTLLRALVHKNSLHEPIAFGPMLLLGGFVMLLWGTSIMNYYLTYL